MFYNHLKTGDYALQGSFRLDGPAGAAPVAAAPVAFRIRPRQPAEDTAYQQFLGFAAINVWPWTVADFDSALAWTSSRLALDHADPFVLPVLIWSDAHTWIAGTRVDAKDAEKLFQLELTIAEAWPRSPIGALAVTYLYAAGPLRYSDRRLPLCATLPGTVVGEIACQRDAWLAREGKARSPN